VDYEARMAALKDESERLRREVECLGKRLRKVDNFSQQYDVEKQEHLKIIEYEARLKSGVERVAIRTAIQQMPRSFYPSFLSLADFDFRVEDLPFIKSPNYNSCSLFTSLEF